MWKRLHLEYTKDTHPNICKELGGVSTERVASHYEVQEVSLGSPSPPAPELFTVTGGGGGAVRQDWGLAAMAGCFVGWP